ncbi:hypothetical protein [Microbacterium sp. NPDC089696]|uniref:hypothetical protein n=1 Tax=Microbacterium sp. NPDC089696 TaxID=3364199 RepID=UPI00380BC4BE
MSEPEPSLIQQRIALDRSRGWAVYGIVGPLVGLGFAVALVFVGNLPWLYAIAGLVFIASAVVSAFRLRDARRDIREFEERYGEDAGTQG